MVIDMKKLINTSFVYALLAMACGVFYREFTKYNGVSGGTSLAFLHGHLCVLGTIAFLIIALLEKQFVLSGTRLFSAFYITYNIGLFITAAAFLWRGILEVLGTPISRSLDASVSGVAGIGHILLGTGIVILFIRLNKCFTK